MECLNTIQFVFFIIVFLPSSEPIIQVEHVYMSLNMLPSPTILLHIFAAALPVRVSRMPDLFTYIFVHHTFHFLFLVVSFAFDALVYIIAPDVSMPPYAFFT